MVEIILIGDSGHAKVIEDCIISQGDKIIAKLDDRYENVIENEPIIRGPIKLLQSLMNQETKVFISIGSNIIRKEIVDRIQIPSSKFAKVIHRTAIISSSAVIGSGTVVMPGAVINAEVKIGSHSIINSNSTIEHDSIIDDFTHISPGSTLTGGVIIEEGAHIGAGSTIIPRRRIGKWSTIGAGSTVISNIDDNSVAVGVPAKVIRREG